MARRPTPGRYGVIDIGSNSIRLVVFDRQAPGSPPVFNEKVLCGLGKDLERDGGIGRDSADMAIANLARFAVLARAMGVRHLDPVGTAAVRDAANGPDFVARVRRETGLKMRVLRGNDEARLSALGVLSGMPGARGAMGDLGGASLELVELGRGEVGRNETLPFGPLRLRAFADKRRGWLTDMIDDRLAALPWLDRAAGRDFIAVGGAWRALARLHMAHADYPLRVIHGYTISRGKAEDFLSLVGMQGRESLERLAPVSRKRVDALPLAALVLERVLRRIKPKRLVFSAYGLREGCLFDRLTPAERRVDPLLATARDHARRDARYEIDAEALVEWTAPLFRRPDLAERRLRLAAAILSDIAWNEHPDYRAETAFLRVLRMPLAGIDHPGRAFLALAVHTRYAGMDETQVTRPAFHLLDEEGLREAYRLGLAFRLAYTLGAGSAALLRGTSLSLGGNRLRLQIPKARRVLVGEAVERRFEALARALDRKPAITS